MWLLAEIAAFLVAAGGLGFGVGWLTWRAGRQPLTRSQWRHVQHERELLLHRIAELEARLTHHEWLDRAEAHTVWHNRMLLEDAAEQRKQLLARVELLEREALEARHDRDVAVGRLGSLQRRLAEYSIARARAMHDPQAATIAATTTTVGGAPGRAVLDVELPDTVPPDAVPPDLRPPGVDAPDLGPRGVEADPIGGSLAPDEPVFDLRGAATPLADAPPPSSPAATTPLEAFPPPSVAERWSPPPPAAHPGPGLAASEDQAIDPGAALLDELGPALVVELAPDLAAPPADPAATPAGPAMLPVDLAAPPPVPAPAVPAPAVPAPPVAAPPWLRFGPPAPRREPRDAGGATRSGHAERLDGQREPSGHTGPPGAAELAGPTGSASAGPASAGPLSAEPAGAARPVEPVVPLEPLEPARSVRSERPAEPAEVSDAAQR